MMVKYLFAILAITVSTSSFSQRFSLAFTDRSYAYPGMDNYVSCTIEGLSNNQVVLSSDNGVFKKEEGRYIYQPQRIADSKIIISKKINGNIQKVGEYWVSVRNLPKGIATIGGASSGDTVSGKTLYAQMGVGCYHAQPSNVCLNYTVLDYTFTAFRGDSLLFYKKQSGNYFTEEIKQFCRSLQSKDKVIVCGITYQRPDGTTEKASAIELEIK